MEIAAVKKPELNISVRNLVEFLMRSGDIDNRRRTSTEDAMQVGSRIHRMIQRRMGSNYRAEVALRYRFEAPNYDVIIEGRADGIMGDMELEQSQAQLLDALERRKQILAHSEEITAAYGEDGFLISKEELIAQQIQELTVEIRSLCITIDEIKSTYRNLDKMKEPDRVHLAQAMCYAYIYATQNQLPHICVRMTYCNSETEEIRHFYFEYSREEITQWFLDLMKQYQKWTDFEFEWREKRQKSIKELEFPYAYREGQKELVTHVYRTLYHQKKLFIEAPTGVGKTLSTVFPTVKSMGEGLTERIFYLTAKTITRTVAEEAFALLRKNKLAFKTVIITAKEKICFQEECICNPEACPYAKGHFDRINDAIYDLLIHEESFTRELVEAYARKHQVCPFEMCLDMSLFADGIICDYNYVFDPHVYLRRFFAEGIKRNYAFLVDEAHNLLDRGREMYSAVLRKEDFLELKKTVKVYDKKLTSALERCNKQLLLLKKECENYQVLSTIDGFVIAAERLYTRMEEFLEKHDDSPIRQEVLDFYFEVSHFLLMYDKMDDNYVIYTENESDGSFILKLFCVDPAKNLAECMQRARSSILFSATLLPIQYYKKLLGGEPEDYEVYAHSVFDPAKRGLYIARDVTSKYTRRGPKEYQKIAAYIDAIVREKPGNYMVFFPSHAFMKDVYQMFEATFYQPGTQECILQEEYMNEEAREAFLAKFRGKTESDLFGQRSKDTSNSTNDLFGQCAAAETKDAEALLGRCNVDEMEDAEGLLRQCSMDETEDAEGLLRQCSMDETEDAEALLGRCNVDKTEDAGDLLRQYDTNMAEDREEATFGENMASSPKTLLGFCVMGGIFSEGIDLKNDSLIGAIVVGTGLPQVCNEREIMKNFFDEKEAGSGFDYAYQYPGMNKVLQAGGRVIRTREDVGIIALLDERFLLRSYQRMFPREWMENQVTDLEAAPDIIRQFWENHN